MYILFYAQSRDFLKSDCELNEMGVDFYTISVDGLSKVYENKRLISTNS